MTPAQFAKYLFSDYHNHLVHHLLPGNCKHGMLVTELTEIARRSNGLLRIQEIGRSLEGRSINLVKIGNGAKKILLWSQMHGDESTATLALVDIFNSLAREGERQKWVEEMLDECCIWVVPMLNPDGAEVRQRRTAAGIDMNRDARALVTPEAVLLRDLQRKFKPRFGFNLHDQELSSVGSTPSVAAIAFLAPALDEKKTVPLVRHRAMSVAALMARSLSYFVEGHIAKYDDAFEPRAFGDNMQLWGTSTVLVESGHWPKDPNKMFIRKLNYVAILSALRSIADGSYQEVDVDHYSSLPENGKRIYDIIIRSLEVVHPSGHRYPSDVGLSSLPTNEDQSARRVIVKDVGDLSTFGALETIAGGQRAVASNELALDRPVVLTELLDHLQLYYPPTS